MPELNLKDVVNVFMSDPVRPEFTGTFTSRFLGLFLLTAHNFSLRQNKLKTEPLIDILPSPANSFVAQISHYVSL